MCGELAAAFSQTRPRLGSSPRVRGTRLVVGFVWPRRSVHPRVCGELGNRAPVALDVDGSSPRVRGTPARRMLGVLSVRFIPACAGNSAPIPTRRRPPPVHPRVCGELAHRRNAPMSRDRFIPACAGNSYRDDARSEPMDGSSPRVRGTQPPFLRRRLPFRFIPACAGNSPYKGTRKDLASVHPRVCGELRFRQGSEGFRFGSSPRVRGTRGNTLSLNPKTPVHPRVCGELLAASAARAAVVGSSPRVRGTRVSTRSTSRRRRFIPACAGNSAGVAAFEGSSSVHPRVCGELASRAGIARRYGGSSPRVRGTRVGGGLVGRGWRFIPACAGNSSPASGRGVCPPVHPRVCGELAPLPHARRPPQRFIPACAGNSSSPPGKTTSSPVHPRVCGELRGCGGVRGLVVGSSPRVRGTLHDGTLDPLPLPGSSPRVRGTRRCATCPS